MRGKITVLKECACHLRTCLGKTVKHLSLNVVAGAGTECKEEKLNPARLMSKSWRLINFPWLSPGLLWKRCRCCLKRESYIIFEALKVTKVTAAVTTRHLLSVKSPGSCPHVNSYTLFHSLIFSNVFLFLYFWTSCFSVIFRSRG